MSKHDLAETIVATLGASAALRDFRRWVATPGIDARAEVRSIIADGRYTSEAIERDIASHFAPMLAVTNSHMITRWRASYRRALYHLRRAIDAGESR